MKKVELFPFLFLFVPILPMYRWFPSCHVSYCSWTDPAETQLTFFTFYLWFHATSLKHRSCGFCCSNQHQSQAQFSFFFSEPWHITSVRNRSDSAALCQWHTMWGNRVVSVSLLLYVSGNKLYADVLCHWGRWIRNGCSFQDGGFSGLELNRECK